jgi:hypothetical protein
MKKIILIVLFISLIIPCFAQNKIKDSVFVRIDQLKPSSLSYRVDKGNIVTINIFIKNKYVNTAGFILADGNADLALKNKKDVSKRVVSYLEFNKMLNKDFRNIWANTGVYFILSESKSDYLTLQVKPILPGELDIQ